jgi:phage/plasmid-like protein (TIGR03299 family)
MSALVETMAYAGEVPWHGIGTKVEDDLTPQEMLEKAGLDWTVEKHKVYYKNADGIYLEAPKKNALVRTSDGQYLDVVSENWNPVQNEEVFEFFTDYVKTGGMTMHTAGSLKEGQVIWGLAKVDESFSLFGGKDVVESYLLLANPHQFGRGVDIRFTPTRVVCHNTLSMALEGKASLGISLNHRKAFDAEKAKELLAEAHQKMETYKEVAEFLSKKRYTEKTLFEYFTNVFPKTGKVDPTKVSNFNDVKALIAEKETESNISRNARKAMDVVNTQPGAELGRGTWWQAYNAITFMTNHAMGHNPDTRMQSVWYGQNKDRNINALGMAVEYAKAV